MAAIHLHPSVILAWNQANEEAFRSNSPKIEPIHLLVGILLVIDGIYPRNMKDSDILDGLAIRMQEISSKCLSILNLNTDECTKLRRKIQFAIHLISSETPHGLLHRSEATRQIFSNAARITVEQGCDTLSLEQITSALQRTLAIRLVDLPDKLNRINSKGNTDSLRITSRHLFTQSLIGEDLTQIAKEGKLRNIVGRDQEISEILRILLRSSKRNAILIGEAGVGKTAVVEGLAQRLVFGNVPADLKDLRIIRVAVSDLIAGTMYRGSLEAKLQELIQTIETDPNIVLFLDEIHLVMSDGGAEKGGMNIANILKPALTRETFACIGATTTAEYDKYLAPDAAFVRRFHLIKISEPDISKTIKICQSWSKNIEERFGIKISEEAIQSAVDLSNKYILDRKQPDKAIDLLEDATASIRMRSTEIISKKEKLVDIGLIKQVLEEKIGIKIDGVIANPEKIESLLHSIIFNQAAAINQISKALTELMSRDLSTGNTHVFIFQGPEKSGKFESALIIANELFPLKNHTLIIDLAGYDSEEDITRLKGVPPGFSGHDQDSQLIKFISHVPQGAIIFRNFEKASHSVQNFVTRILSEMKFLDTKDRAVNLGNYLCILLCNTSISAEIERGDGEALHQYNWLIEFDKISIQVYGQYFDMLFQSLQEDILKKEFYKITIDDSSRMNTVIYLTERSTDKPSFKRGFDQIITKKILIYLTKNPKVKCVNVVWMGKGLEISGE